MVCYFANAPLAVKVELPIADCLLQHLSVFLSVLLLFCSTFNKISPEELEPRLDEPFLRQQDKVFVSLGHTLKVPDQSFDKPFHIATLKDPLPFLLLLDDHITVLDSVAPRLLLLAELHLTKVGAVGELLLEVLQSEYFQLGISE